MGKKKRLNQNQKMVFKNMVSKCKTKIALMIKNSHNNLRLCLDHTKNESMLPYPIIIFLHKDGIVGTGSYPKSILFTDGM